VSTLGATLGTVSPGVVEIAIIPHAAISQQHGFVHAGAVAAMVTAGQTLTVAQSEVFAESGGQEKLVALLTATLMTVEAQEGISD